MIRPFADTAAPKYLTAVAIVILCYPRKSVFNTVLAINGSYGPGRAFSCVLVKTSLGIALFDGLVVKVGIAVLENFIFSCKK